mgnify:CR=1 FL=1
MACVKTIKYDVQAGHPYHVYCEQGGTVYACGADDTRTQVGILEKSQSVRVVPASGKVRLEADVPDTASVKFRDPLEDKETWELDALTGHYYSFICDDDCKLTVNGVPLLEFPAFGGRGALLAPACKLTIRARRSMNFSMVECPPCQPQSLYDVAVPYVVCTENGENP